MGVLYVNVGTRLALLAVCETFPGWCRLAKLALVVFLLLAVDTPNAGGFEGVIGPIVLFPWL